MSDLFEKFRKKVDKKLTEILNEIAPFTLIQQYAEGAQKYGRSSGMKRFDYFQQVLEHGFGDNWERAYFQTEFHNLCSCALSQLILGNDWQKEGKGLMKAWGWKLISKMLIGLAPRRFGKSACMGMLVAALSDAFLTILPDLQSKRDKLVETVISTGKRASGGLSTYVKDFIALRGLDQYIDKYTDETITLLKYNPNTGRNFTIFLNFYPSNSVGLRGTHADFLIGEEAAYHKVELFLNYVAPLFGMGETVYIAISSPAGFDNYLNNLFELVDDDGNQFILKYQVELVCAQCKLTRHPEECTHLLHLMPPWKSITKNKMVNIILHAWTVFLLRENMGVITGGAGGSLMPYIDPLLDDDPLDIKRDPASYPRFVLTVCDPNAAKGLYTSEMALLSMTYINGKFVVSLFYLFFRQAKRRNPKTIVVNQPIDEFLLDAGFLLFIAGRQIADGQFVVQFCTNDCETCTLLSEACAPFLNSLRFLCQTFVQPRRNLFRIFAKVFGKVFAVYSHDVFCSQMSFHQRNQIILMPVFETVNVADSVLFDEFASDFVKRVQKGKPDVQPQFWIFLIGHGPVD